MKFILTLIITTLTSLTVLGQISDVQISKNYVSIYGDNNNIISRLYLGSTNIFVGSTSTFYLIRRSHYICLFSPDSRQISQLYISDDSWVTGVYNKSFTVRVGNYIRTYDMNCNQINQRYSSNSRH
jgi:hypothetical protein